MPARFNYNRLAILAACAVILAGSLGVSAALQEQAGTTSAADATSSLLPPASADATSAPALAPAAAATTDQAPVPPIAPSDATADQIAVPVTSTTEATGDQALIPSPAPMPVPTPSPVGNLGVSAADLIAAGFQDVKEQPSLGAGQRFDVHDTAYYRVNQTNLGASSRWVAEGTADVVSVYISRQKGCPAGIVGAPQLNEIEGRTQVRFCHSQAEPVYVVITGPDKDRVIELGDIIDKK